MRRLLHSLVRCVVLPDAALDSSHLLCHARKRKKFAFELGNQAIALAKDDMCQLASMMRRTGMLSSSPKLMSLSMCHLLSLNHDLSMLTRE